MLGLAGAIQITIAHHVLLFVLASNIEPLYLFFFPFSIMWVWTVAWLEDGNKLSIYYGDIYATLFKSNVFWMQILMGTMMLVMPFYAWLKWRQFFGGDPRFDLTYQKKFARERLGEKESNAEEGQFDTSPNLNDSKPP